MKREIKFRVWIKTPKGDWEGACNFDEFDWDNRMREVSFMSLPLGCPSGKDIRCKSIIDNETYDDNYASGWHSIDEVELMQFTGLQDKNDKYIYEGDIVKNDRGETKAITDIFDFVYEVNYSEDHSGLNGWTRKEFEVIGNIHQNPELL